MKLFKSVGQEYLELLACQSLPGENAKPAPGFTCRAYMTDDLDSKTEPPHRAQIRTSCDQSFPSSFYEEIPINVFRILMNRIWSGIALEWHGVSQMIQPDLWLNFGFDEFNKREKDAA